MPASVALLALLALVLGTTESDVLPLALGPVLIVGVVGVARRAAVAYPVPLAIASMIAYDWYYLPPTHADPVPDLRTCSAWPCN